MVSRDSRPTDGGKADAPCRWRLPWREVSVTDRPSEPGTTEVRSGTGMVDGVEQSHDRYSLVCERSGMEPDSDDDVAV